MSAMESSCWSGASRVGVGATGSARGDSLRSTSPLKRPRFGRLQEESGVKSEVIGLLGMRNLYTEDNGNSTYMVMLMRPLEGEPEPDAQEVDQAAFFTLEEILQLEQVPPVNIEIAHRALDPKHLLLYPMPMTHASGAEYTFFVG